MLGGWFPLCIRCSVWTCRTAGGRRNLDDRVAHAIHGVHDSLVPLCRRSSTCRETRISDAAADGMQVTREVSERTWPEDVRANVCSSRAPFRGPIAPPTHGYCCHRSTTILRTVGDCGGDPQPEITLSNVMHSPRILFERAAGYVLFLTSGEPLRRRSAVRQPVRKAVRSSNGSAGASMLPVSRIFVRVSHATRSSLGLQDNGG